MLGGMVPLPVLPVKAPSSNFQLRTSNACICHTSRNSLKSSTSWNAISTHFDVTLRPAKSFTLISFADPHPLNPVVSYRYKNIGGTGVSTDKIVAHTDFIFGSVNSFALNLFADPHPLTPYGSISYKIRGGRGLAVCSTFHSLPTFRIRRRIPPARSLPSKNLALLY